MRVLFTIWAFFSHVIFSSNPIVFTPSGPVQGFTKTTLNKTINVFLGVPFAKPPIEDLRFKKPFPRDPWTEVFDATKFPNACHQKVNLVYGPGFPGEDMWIPNTPMSEDCLYLNLWVPEGATNATTLIWIHGGGFHKGSSSLDVYDGSILAANSDVIVASMNYRLGALGFLYLGIDDAPGNVGFHDQALAIQWIKNNIQYFGGNPESLTLFGESAGSESISIHLMSTVSNNIVRRAILESGVVTSPWSYVTAETGVRAARELLTSTRCMNQDNAIAMECLRKVDIETILLHQSDYTPLDWFTTPYGPLIDGIVLTKNPMEMLNEGAFPKVDVLLGTNKDEGTFFIIHDWSDYFVKDVPTNLTWSNYTTIVDKMFPLYLYSKTQRDAIYSQYTDWNNAQNEGGSFSNTQSVSDIYGDRFEVCPANFWAQKMTELGSNVYYYHFTHRSSSSPWGEWMGITHRDEIEYVFGVPLNPSSNFTENEKNLSRRMMDYWATFAKSGKPIEADGPLDWPNYSKQAPQYFNLNAEEITLGYGPRTDSCFFWNELFPTLNSSKLVF